MKNLLIYINPSKEFDEEHKALIKIQIENSLDLGWKREDIELFTNFPYEFMGVEAQILPDSTYCEVFKQATKVDVIDYLFDNYLIKNDLYWMHDLDAFQQEVITKQELGLDGYELGLTDYGRKERWNGGSIFFKPSTGDYFKLVKTTMYAMNEDYKGVWKNEEDVMVKLTDENVNNINSRIKRLNITYNFGIRKIALCYEKAIKPIKVMHFHPTRVYWGKTTAWDIVKGKNDLKMPLMPQRLINIFNKYGYA